MEPLKIALIAGGLSPSRSSSSIFLTFSGNKVFVWEFSNSYFSRILDHAREAIGFDFAIVFVVRPIASSELSTNSSQEASKAILLFVSELTTKLMVHSPPSLKAPRW